MRMGQLARYFSTNCCMLRSTAGMNNSLWEEQAFAEDVSGINKELGGCVWPPRSYSCSFCARDFRSAQALGGHMNVHRRDRASRFVEQSSPIVIPHHQTDELVPQKSRASKQYCISFDDIPPSPASRVSTLWYTNPNPNPNPGLFPDNTTGSLVVSPSSHDADEILADSIKIRQGKKSKANGAKIQDFRTKDLSIDEVTSCKRRRLMEAKPPSILFPKLSAVDRIFLPQAEVSYKLRSGSFEELDLELRLGAWYCDPKVKL